MRTSTASSLRQAAGYFNMAETARAAGVSPCQLSDWVRGGLIPVPSARFNGLPRRYYTLAEVRAIRRKLNPAPATDA